MSLRRFFGVCAALVVLAGVVLCRTYWVGRQTAYAASAGGQTVQTLALPRARGDFFDRNGRRLTGTTPRYYALCMPGEAGYTALFPYVSYENQGLLYERRNLAAPFLVEVDRDLTAQGIQSWMVPRHFTGAVAAHLLGYLDGEGHGSSGLERAYDTLLTAAGDKRSVTCLMTAQGRLLADTSPAVVVEEPGTGHGVRLTLDADVQRACEALAAETMPRGCILVMDTATGELLASVSTPAFDPQNIAASIRADDTSLLNRPFCAFSAGSVFKVVLAAAAYENGLDWFTHDCTGEIEVAGQTYRCAQGRAHGVVNLRGALEQSCNTYFVALGQLLGGEVIRAEAEKLGFGTAAQIAPGLKTAAGTLPEAEALQNPGELATFSFGQGALTVTPLQITAMMNTAAGGGVYKAPAFVQGITDADGTLTEPLTPAVPRTVLDKATARVLRSMLESVVTDGIGSGARPGEGTAGGKTGTAQTGQYNAEGEELLNYWFSGFYPAEAPRYTITILQDGILKPETSSAALFARVTEILRVWEGG